jgi:O-antigen/teichoic acid export membrane protein
LHADFKSRFENVVHGVLSRYVATAVGIVTSIILTPLLLSHLGKEVYGLYAALGSIMAYLFVLEFGTGSAVPKYVAELWAQKDAEGLSRLVSSFFFGFLAVCLLLIIGAVVSLPVVPHLFKTSPALVRTADVVFFITIANFSIILPFSTMGGLLYGIHRVYISYWLDAVFYVLNLLGAYVAVKLHYGLVGVALGTLGARIIIVTFLAWFARTRCPAVKFRLAYFDWSLVKRLSTPSFYYFVIDLSSLVILSTDQVIISSLIGVAAVTAYSIVFRLWRIPAGLITTLSQVLLPHISELGAGGNLPQLRTIYSQLTKYSLLFAMGAFACVAAFGEKLIGLWVGPENFVGTSVLLCFGLMFPIHTIVGTSAEVLIGMAQHKKLAWVLFAEGMLNVGLSILFLRRFGVLGVAMGTVIARLVTSFWFAPWYVCRLLHHDFREYLKNAGLVVVPFVPSFGFALIVRRWNTSPFLTVFGGSLAICAIYLAIFCRLSLNREERKNWWNRAAELAARSASVAYVLRGWVKSVN